MKIKELSKKIQGYVWVSGTIKDKQKLVLIHQALTEVSKGLHTGTLDRQNIPHTKILDRDELFDSIDIVIQRLASLKEQGYSEIDERWSGYEHNYFVAIKIELETDEEYYRRLADLVTPIINEYLKIEKDKNKIIHRIKELKSELSTLQNKVQEDNV